MRASDILYIAEVYGLPDDTVAELLALVGPAEHSDTRTRYPDTPTVQREPIEAARPDLLRTPVDRYEDLGPLGRGGMGEVRRVRDRNLHRVLAMKIARFRSEDSADQVTRFIDEARIASQLQHPGIVPVHELGYLGDGRPYFTMREVHGRTLSDAIREVHGASEDGRWAVAASGWTFRRLVDAFHRCCETLAYAHDRGVIHRDLKPDNIMVGAFGEVVVMDWGLARVRDAPLQDYDEPTELIRRDPIQTERGFEEAMRTRMGTVAGTPSYMSPEQAVGRVDQIGPPSDVYALGAILYEILTGRPPYWGRNMLEVLDRVRSGPPDLPTEVVAARAAREGTWRPAPIPAELQEICMRAMSRAPADRFANASALAQEVNAWLEGARRRDQALDIVSRADALVPEKERLRREAAELRASASRLLIDVSAHAPPEDKEPGWALEDEADRLERQARLKELENVQLLRAALTTDAELVEAHDRLADFYQTQQADAEARLDQSAAEGFALLLRAHGRSASHAAWLRGDGALTLVTDPPGATVRLFRYEERARRLVPTFVEEIGPTPIVERRLPMGSYLCEIYSPDREIVRYPVFIRRQEHWHGVPPGSVEPHPVWLPPSGELGADDCYVPSGWFLAGPPGESTPAPLSPVWVPGFIIRRTPITNAEYLAFLDDLVAQGREDEALRHAPSERAGRYGERGAMLYGRTKEGRFQLITDQDGDQWLPEYPVLYIDWHDAWAAARWLARRTGQPWRLPWELEWEKAARGVDGRPFPWGSFLDPSFCRMRDSHAARRLPGVVGGEPVDESPYRVRGLAGNVRDWCVELDLADANPWPDAEQRALLGSLRSGTRGGSWLSAPENLAVGLRFDTTAIDRKETLSARLLRPTGS